MLPCGHPEPPYTTLVILKDDGAVEGVWEMGLAEESAAMARVA